MYRDRGSKCDDRGSRYVTEAESDIACLRSRSCSRSRQHAMSLSASVVCGSRIEVRRSRIEVP